MVASLAPIGSMICFFLLISMLRHRQAIFESKGDKLSPSAEFGIRTRVSGTESPADWMSAGKPTELSRIKLKNLNSIALPYDQRAFSPLDPTAVWLSHLALAIYVFVVVNFDDLAQASDFRIKRRQVVFLCQMQDSNQGWQPWMAWAKLTSIKPQLSANHVHNSWDALYIWLNRGAEEWKIWICPKTVYHIWFTLCVADLQFYEESKLIRCVACIQYDCLIYVGCAGGFVYWHDLSVALSFICTYGYICIEHL